MDNKKNIIFNMASALPELYQPVYKHSEFCGKESRPCQDRLEKISQACQALENLLNRPLNILDLGCAQGYFSLSLAEKGHNLHGVDIQQENIAFCNALAEENSFNCIFETARVEDIIQKMYLNQYDVILGLSVFHHIIQEKGEKEVKKVIEKIINQSGFFITELALHTEPLYWATNQPSDPKILLEQAAFLHEAQKYKTHLSDVKRPMFFVSNKYWVLDDLAEKIDTWSENGHRLSSNTFQNSRRYFFGKKYIVKKYLFNHILAETNKLDFKNEKLFLLNPVKNFFTVKSPLIKKNDNEGWVVMERLQGMLLLEAIDRKIPLDSFKIVISVLDQLITLEEENLFHNDLRTWNIFLTKEGLIRLIDYGSISQKKEDCVWPGNIFFAFFLFLHEVLTTNVGESIPIRSAFISPFNLPDPFKNPLIKLWAIPIEQWSFKLIRELIFKCSENNLKQKPLQAQEVWIMKMEEAIESIKQHSKGSIKHLIEVQKEVKETKRKLLKANSQIETIYNTRSWKITKPLRIIIKMVKHIKKNLFMK